MIEEISIRGLGVIEDAVLQLGPGLTVITGETGAGKTMVMTGLGLLLGGRGDAGLVRPTPGRLVVEGRVRVDPDGKVAARAIEAGAQIEDGVLILGRTIGAEGRSRAQMGGASVPVGVLAELGEHLVAVHGQTDQQHLRSPAQQRELLDRYGGAPLAEALRDYGRAYRQLAEIRRRRLELVEHARERAHEADALRAVLEEVSALDPQPGEDVALTAEIARLSHAETLQGAAAAAHELLRGDPEQRSGPEVATLLAQARRHVEAAAAHDPQLADLGHRLAELGYLLDDLGADLASYAAAIDADPVRLAAATDRRAALGRLLRRYGDTIDEVRARAEAGARRLTELDADADTTAELRAAEAAGLELLAAAGARLSLARAEAAARLEKAVAAELVALAMPGARLTVGVQQQPPNGSNPDAAGLDDRGPGFGRHGLDEVEMLLTAHPDAPPRPVQRAASGGELSRIMLAVQVVLAGSDPVPTFVFDEIDAGIGGRAAVEVGRRLARLAAGAQVLVVTHLPQVAAFADQHLVVARGAGPGARTEVRRVTGADQLRELARMLAGQADSATARAHAEELLAAARALQPVPNRSRGITQRRDRRAMGEFRGEVDTHRP